MKKLLSMALALVMTCGVMTACGSEDSSEKKTTTTEATATTTTTAATTTEATTTTAEPAPQPAPIDEVSDTLANQETASITFTADSDISWIAMFNEKVVNNKLKEAFVPGDADYTGDEAVLDISLAELDGITMVKVDNIGQTNGVLTKPDTNNPTWSDGSERFAWWNPKVRFDMNALFAGQEEKMSEIFTVKMDLVIVANDNAILDDQAGTLTEALVPGWNGGAFGTNNDEAWNGNALEWEAQDYLSEWVSTELTIRPGLATLPPDPQPEDWVPNASKMAFDPAFETNSLTFMAWGVSHDVDYYIANLTFLDVNNEVITLD